MMRIPTLSFKAYNIWSNPLSYFGAHVFSPCSTLLLFYFMGTISGSSGSFLLRSVFAILLNEVVMESVMFIQAERRFNTFAPLLVTPIPRLKLFFLRVIGNYFQGVVFSALYLSCAFSFLGSSYTWGRFLSLLLLLALCGLALLWLSIILGFFSLLFEDVSLFVNISYHIILIASGLFFPFDMGFAGRLIPLRFAARISEKILSGGGMDFAEGAILGAYALAYFCATALLLHPVEFLLMRLGAREE